MIFRLQIKEVLSIDKSGSRGWIRTNDQAVNSRSHTLKLLNKLSVTELAELSNSSKSYISQVKCGKRPPSEKLLEALSKQGKDKRPNAMDYDTALELFLKSRREGISPNTLRDYRKTLGRALYVLGLAPHPRAINAFFSSLQCSLGGKYDYFKCLRAFYNWLYCPSSSCGFRPEDNPIVWIDAPKRPQLILPSLEREQVMELIKQVSSVRDKAIIALFAESGLRLSELTNIKPSDIAWENHTIPNHGQGQERGLLSVW